MKSEYIRTDKVPREFGLPPENFKSNYFSKQRPVIMPDKTEGWRSLEEWSPESLKELYGAIKINASIDIPERGDDFSYWGSDVRWITLAEFVDHLMTSDRPCYARQAPSERFPDFDKYYDFNVCLDMMERKPKTGIWFGSGRTDSGVHWDTESNFIAQIYGHKRLALFSPDDCKYLYPYRDQLRWTSFNAFAPDFERFPKARNATPYFAELNPGEILHIPKGWWHQLISMDISITLNCFFQPSCGLSHFIKSITTSGPLHVARVSRDFVMLGLFKSQRKVQTVSDVPTGLFLYNIMRGAIARRLGRS